MRAVSLRIRPLLSASDPAFPAVEALYEASFPPEERVPAHELARTIDPLLLSAPGQATVQHLLVAEDASSVVAMAYFSYLARVDLGFITYLAVAPELNGHGIGSRLLRACLDQLALDADFAGGALRATVFETERVGDANDESDLAVRRRRLAFFDHAGAQVVTDAYVQPPLAEGLPAVPFNLLIFPGRQPLTARELIESFYSEAYGLSAEHPLVARVAAAAESGTFAPGRADRPSRPSE